MSKLLLSFLIIIVVSCNTKSNNNTNSADSLTAAGAQTKSYTWTDSDEKEFLAACVQSAKANLNDTAAFKQCNCVLKQLKQNFPTLDSANNSADSAQLVAFAANCK